MRGRVEGCNQLLGISQGDDGHGLFLRRVLSTAQMDPNNNQDDPWFLLGVNSFGTKVSQIGKSCLTLLLSAMSRSY